MQGDYDEDGKRFIGKWKSLILINLLISTILLTGDKQLIQQARKLQQSEINKYLNRNSPFSGFWENIIQHENEELPEETKY